MPTPAQPCNPWLGRKYSKDMLEKIYDVFMEALGDDADYGTAKAEFDSEMSDFFNSCSIEDVEKDEDSITIRLQVPPPELTLDV